MEQKKKKTNKNISRGLLRQYFFLGGWPYDAFDWKRVEALLGVKLLHTCASGIFNYYDVE